MPERAFVLSGESSIRFTTAWTMLVYVTLSAFTPAEDKELKVERAITTAFLFLSSLPVALAHVFILCAKYA